MKKGILLLTLILFSASSWAEELLIDIPSIVGKSESQVSDMIGEPTSCNSIKYGNKCQYKMAETEIVFINGKADWITVEGLDDKPFTSATLKHLGLRPVKATFSNAFTLRWESLQGLRSVSLFKAGNNADYAYIKAYTK